MALLVSINITTYNRADLLPRCLDSILKQSYENIELIVVDDASGDKTETIVRAYQKKDPRIKYFKHEKNMGNAYARNTAWKNCTGEFVAFMDDDDEWVDDDKIKKQVEIFENDKNGKIGIVCSSVNLIDADGNIVPKIIKHSKNIKNTILAGNGIIYSPTVMTRKSLLDKTGGFDTKQKRGVDSSFYRECIIRHGYEVHFLSDITTNVYEYGSDRMTNFISIKPIVNMVKTDMYIIRKYFKSYLLNPICAISF